jgi:hypothetical protein
MFRVLPNVIYIACELDGIVYQVFIAGLTQLCSKLGSLTCSKLRFHVALSYERLRFASLHERLLYLLSTAKTRSSKARELDRSCIDASVLPWPNQGEPLTSLNHGLWDVCICQKARSPISENQSAFRRVHNACWPFVANIDSSASGDLNARATRRQSLHYLRGDLTLYKRNKCISIMPCLQEVRWADSTRSAEGFAEVEVPPEFL